SLPRRAAARRSGATERRTPAGENRRRPRPGSLIGGSRAGTPPPPPVSRPASSTAALGIDLERLAGRNRLEREVGVGDRNRRAGAALPILLATLGEERAQDVARGIGED